jgi:pantoate--beta-alanine ligase
MEIVTTLAELHNALASSRAPGQRIAFVPTMGNLHRGHLRLVEVAKQRAPKVVVSIFVNPLQFGPNEDFANYPRTLEQDSTQLQDAGVAVLFTPDEKLMYPNGATHTSFIDVPDLANILEGAHRAGHFRGVATVVAKLFNMVQPHHAVFGEKDFQQLLVIRAMVRDLAFPLEIIGVPTERDAAGLALSSRNGYLTAQERQLAPLLYQSLCEVRDAVRRGEDNFVQLEQQAVAHLTAGGFKPQYVAIRDAQSLLPVKNPTTTPLVILAAAYLGKTRLLDNLRV